MSGRREHRKVERRNVDFVERPVTKIWHEESSTDNPYLAESCRCYGYDLLELLKKRSFVEIQYLLFRGELPSFAQVELLEKLLVALINPGPRHPATRAAMCAGVGKTDAANMLPLSLSVLGGSHQGAAEVKDCLVFLLESAELHPSSVASEVLSSCPEIDGDKKPAPGFGSRFGSIDMFAGKIADYLIALPGSNRHLSWGAEFVKELNKKGMGWHRTGIAAAALADLGFHPLQAVGMYQLICAPGILAHGLEMQDKPLTAMPFPSDDKYIIEENE